MKKYLVVAWDHYYPAPGLGNIKDSFDIIFTTNSKGWDSYFIKPYEKSGYDRVYPQIAENIKVTLKGDERNILELINADVFAKIEELCGIN